METQVQEATTAFAAPAPLAAGELLAELRDQPTKEAPAPLAALQPAKLELSLKDAALLYTILRDKIEANPPPEPPEGDSPEPRSDMVKLLNILDERLRALSSTAGPKTTVVLQLARHEAGFLKRTVGNKKKDEARREKTRQKHFSS